MRLWRNLDSLVIRKVDMCPSWRVNINLPYKRLNILEVLVALMTLLMVPSMTHNSGNLV